MNADTQNAHSKDLECLGTMSGNCHIIDGLQESIKYSHQTSGHVAKPLCGSLKKLLTGPIGTVSTELSEYLTQHSGKTTKTSNTNPIVIMDTTLVASPIPNPTLTVVLILSIKIRMVEGYCLEKSWGIPQYLLPEHARTLIPATLNHGCNMLLLPHQQKALEFIQQLEFPKSTILSTFCDSPIESLQHLVENGKTSTNIHLHTQ
ncbi:hypothetical protein VP01_196g11 [Puccinia sorghi]|uniref:Uncharacterized protein n=1 Tax=Puccinia sorghi TaxID=27349 RepID=A0A0L6VCD1_9BASI|nr:hypothetical protein VP01_196g11 [Puccinia sorghi]